MYKDEGKLRGKLSCKKEPWSLTCNWNRNNDNCENSSEQTDPPVPEPTTPPRDMSLPTEKSCITIGKRTDGEIKATPKVDSLEECAAECLAMGKECAAWNFKDAKKKVCQLVAKGKAVKDKSWDTSGRKCTDGTNGYPFGGDALWTGEERCGQPGYKAKGKALNKKTIKKTIKNLNDCVAECEKTKKCKYWTWNAQKGVCQNWAKGKKKKVYNPDNTKDSGRQWLSGVKDCEYALA